METARVSHTRGHRGFICAVRRRTSDRSRGVTVTGLCPSLPAVRRRDGFFAARGWVPKKWGWVAAGWESVMVHMGGCGKSHRPAQRRCPVTRGRRSATREGEKVDCVRVKHLSLVGKAGGIKRRGPCRGLLLPHLCARSWARPHRQDAASRLPCTQRTQNEQRSVAPAGAPPAPRIAGARTMGAHFSTLRIVWV